MEELKFKYDGLDVNRLTEEELSIFKIYNKIQYNKQGDYFMIFEYDIRFFKHNNRKEYFFTINTYPNNPEKILKYLNFNI